MNLSSWPSMHYCLLLVNDKIHSDSRGHIHVIGSKSVSSKDGATSPRNEEYSDDSGSYGDLARALLDSAELQKHNLWSVTERYVSEEDGFVVEFSVVVRVGGKAPVEGEERGGGRDNSEVVALIQTRRTREAWHSSTRPGLDRSSPE